jgi:hypothetical protein
VNLQDIINSLSSNRPMGNTVEIESSVANIDNPLYMLIHVWGIFFAGIKYK